VEKEEMFNLYAVKIQGGIHLLQYRIAYGEVRKVWENIHHLASFHLGLLYRYKLSDRFFLHGSAQYKQRMVPLGCNSVKLNQAEFSGWNRISFWA
jgi:hypothetical protein